MESVAPQTSFPVVDMSVNKHNQSLNEWLPPEGAVPFIHNSINVCDEMRSHNYVIDYDATFTGTPGITAHPLTNIDDDFDTYWQADNTVADDDQYFEIELAEAVFCDSHIFNMYKPQDYRVSPYTPSPKCWKAWTLKGKLLSGDEWTTLETVTANDIKFYKGTFTRGKYRYFRLEGISAYNDTAQTARVDAYLYTMGVYDSTTKYNEMFPDAKRGINDVNSYPEKMAFLGHDIYITALHGIAGNVYDLAGPLQKVMKGVIVGEYRDVGSMWAEYYDIPSNIDNPPILQFTRLSSLDFVANSGICLYMFPPPNEIWWFVNSAYAFDETSANMNTPIILKSPDSSCKVVPVLTTVRSYDTYSVLGARYKDTRSGEFKVNNYYITFSDPVNMDSQIKFNGQACEGLITDMDGTALTGASNANSNVTVARLKIGDVYRGRRASITFNPPLKLDGDVPTDVFEMYKSEIAKGSVLRQSIQGFKVPKE